MSNTVTIISRGVTGSGKTTLLSLLAQRLARYGIDMEYEGYDFDSPGQLLEWANGREDKMPDILSGMKEMGLKVRLIEQQEPPGPATERVRKALILARRYEKAGPVAKEEALKNIAQLLEGFDV